MILFVKKQNILWNLECFFLCQVTKNWWFGLVVWSWGQGLFFDSKKVIFLMKSSLVIQVLGDIFFGSQATCHVACDDPSTSNMQPGRKNLFVVPFCEVPIWVFPKWGYSTPKWMVYNGKPY